MTAGQKPNDKPGSKPEAGGVAALWIAADPASQRILEMARKVAATTSTLLLRGESGTGKDLLAQVIHYLSPSREEPYIKIDCASLPPELVESELFGHERGAFTGASSQKRGRLEMAASGTIVLDEVAGLTMAMQAKILRVVEEKKFERLGGNVTLRMDSRLIALTHADLEAAVRQRAFREDLYYRLNVVPIEIPPLRARRKDIIPMAEQMLLKLCQIHRKPPLTMSLPVRKVLETYDFPGNGRELRNIIERAVLIAAGDEMLTSHLPLHLAEARPGSGMERLLSLEDMEQQYISEVLDHTHGRKSRAAKILGISRKTLLEKRKRYGLD